MQLRENPIAVQVFDAIVACGLTPAERGYSRRLEAPDVYESELDLRDRFTSRGLFGIKRSFLETVATIQFNSQNPEQGINAQNFLLKVRDRAWMDRAKKVAEEMETHLNGVTIHVQYHPTRTLYYDW